MRAPYAIRPHRSIERYAGDAAAGLHLPSGRAFSMAITVLAQGGGRQLLAWKDE
jgi:hypothetical protein